MKADLNNRRLIKLCIVGFTSKGAYGVGYFISKHVSKNYQLQIVSQVADDVLVLVDRDTIDGQVYLTDTKTEQQKILVAQYKKDPNCSFPWLMKPIIPRELVEKLINLYLQNTSTKPPESNNKELHGLNHSKLTSALVGNKADVSKVNANKQIPTEEVNFYNPKNYLQGVVMRCIKNATANNPFVQAYLPFGDLVVDMSSKKAYLMLGNKKIRSFEKLCLDPNVLISSIPEVNKITLEVKDNQVMPLDDFLWNLSVAASYGRLPKGVDVDKPMRLRHWPNLTRLRRFDHASQIAALWSQQSLSIRSVVEKLGVGYKFVYAFFAAADALDMMAEGEDKEVRLDNTESGTVKHRSIMSRLLSHLRKAS